MPEQLFDSGSNFDSKKIALAQWLRQHLASVRVLGKSDLETYGKKEFIAGWATEIMHNGAILAFHILIDAQFPYSPIRIAYKSEEVYLKWPHVEERGLLCLPQESLPIASVEDAIDASLNDALTLVDQCQDPTFIENELRREFISYWNRSDHNDAKRVRSLLDPTNHTPRLISVWYGKEYTLVGEHPDQVRSWLQNRGRQEESRIDSGIFGFLDKAPAPPFPENPKQLFTLLKHGCPGIDTVLARHPIAKDMTIVLAASSPSGEGLITMQLSAPKMAGFRKNKQLPLPSKKQLWALRSNLKRSEVDRYDSNWVHGRGMDRHHSVIHQAAVLVVGCGSLGSQVAMRLAQSGVGSLVLVDPDTLAPANVGRHALGIDSVGQFKASELAKLMRRRFPHMRNIEGHCRPWQCLDSDIFGRATMIVACLGEWSADGQLGEWQTRMRSLIPIVYGWLDEQGTASHALALTGQGPALSCVLDPDGRLRIPETLWIGDGRVQAEPACGTFFQPYGPLDVTHAESLVTRLCLDVLTSSSSLPIHRVYAGSTIQIGQAGGEWSSEHLKYRPQGYDGPFEYERPVSRCGHCPACAEAL